MKVAVAECLCEGCILLHHENKMPSEDFTFNSVPVVQNKMFLKKELCEDAKKYRLRTYFEDVAVGCTCATAKS